MMFWLVVCIVALIASGIVASIAHNPYAFEMDQHWVYYLMGWVRLVCVISILALIVGLAYKYLR